MSAILDNRRWTVYNPSMYPDTRPRLLLNRVQERRKSLRMTQTALSKRAGVSRQTIWKLEQRPGYGVPKMVCVRLADALSVEEAWLFYEQDQAS
jgi:DNA-binding XRE family transcriptional regulator